MDSEPVRTLDDCIHHVPLLVYIYYFTVVIYTSNRNLEVHHDFCQQVQIRKDTSTQRIDSRIAFDKNSSIPQAVSEEKIMAT